MASAIDFERRRDSALAHGRALRDDAAEEPAIDEDVAGHAWRVARSGRARPGRLESDRKLLGRPRERAEDRFDRLGRRDVRQDKLLRPGRCG